MKYLIILLAMLALSVFRLPCYGLWDLVLSEVYLKGNADWIEISNIGDQTFNGTISLSGANTPGTEPPSFDVDNLVVTGGQAVVIARYGLSSYDYFQNIAVIGAINSKLTLSATGRNIELWHQGTLLDQFVVDYPTVQANDTTTSFSKKEKFGPVSISLSQDTWNVLPGYIASPGTYVVPSGEGQVTSSGTLPVIASGAWQSGSNVTGTVPPATPICIQDANRLRISEIFFGDQNRDPFIEFQGLSDFQGPVTLSGTLLGLSTGQAGLSFTIDLNVTQSGYMVLSRGANGLLAGPDQISNSALVLHSSGGTLLVSGQSGQVLDSVQIPPLGGLGVRYGTQSDGCQHFLTGGQKPSPGFDERFLYYFFGSNSSPAGVTPEASGATGNCPVCSCGTTNSEQLTTNNGEQITVNPSLSGPSGPSSLKILSLDLTSTPGFQTVILQSSLLTSIILSSSSVYRLHSTNRTTNNIINGTLLPGEVKSFTGNRKFPTTANCIELLSGMVVIDKFCYGNGGGEAGNGEPQTGNTETGAVIHVPLTVLQETGSVNDSMNFKNYVIKITSIDYDPYGTDAGNEKIGLLLLSGDEINLKPLTLKIGTQIRHLSGILTLGGEKIFKGSFGFPNSTKNGQDIVVSLVMDEYVFDTYTYNPEKIQPGNYLVTSVLDGDTIRIKYNNSTKSIRFLGMDAPESNKTRYGKVECRGSQAKKYLTDTLKDKTISLVLDPSQGSVDSYDRILGYVYLDGELINQKMLALGYAKEYTYTTEYQFRDQFLLAQESAKTNSVGMRDPKICKQTTLSGALEETNQTGEIEQYLNSGLGLKIKNILPNPKGKDQGREYLTLIFYAKDQSSSGMTIPDPIILSDGRHLLINDQKKKLKGSAALNQETIITGNFAIPNKAACIAVGYGDTIFDKLCYDMPQEDELIGEGKPILEELTDGAINLLGQVSIRQIDNRLCVVYMDQTLLCRNIPPGKTSIKLKNENKLYKNYISLIEGYLSTDRKMLLENTKIGDYISVFKNAKKYLKVGKQKIQIGNSWADVYDLKEQLALKYTLPSIQHIQIDFPEIVKWYASFLEEYESRKISKMSKT